MGAGQPALAERETADPGTEHGWRTVLSRQPEADDALAVSGGEFDGIRLAGLRCGSAGLHRQDAGHC